MNQSNQQQKTISAISIFLYVMGFMFLLAAFFVGISISEKTLTVDPAYLENYTKYPRLYSLEDAPMVKDYSALLYATLTGLFAGCVCWGFGALVHRFDVLALSIAQVSSQKQPAPASSPEAKAGTVGVSDSLSRHGSQLNAADPVDGNSEDPVLPIEIDLKEGRCTCPRCGQRQNTGRARCMNCSVKFGNY